MRLFYILRTDVTTPCIADLSDMRGNSMLPPNPANQIYDKCWWVHRINVPRDVRRRGLGTQLLQMILTDADSEGITLYLEVATSGDMTNDQLCQWYAKHGFYQHPDADWPMVWYRPPAVHNSNRKAPQ